MIANIFIDRQQQLHSVARGGGGQNTLCNSWMSPWSPTYQPYVDRNSGTTDMAEQVVSLQCRLKTIDTANLNMELSKPVKLNREKRKLKI